MFSVSLAENVGEVKKNGFTFAPEAGSVRMRRFINKNISNEELFQSIETAYRQGWNLVKLYFMIGLPTETDADIRELVDLIREVGRIGKKVEGWPKKRQRQHRDVRPQVVHAVSVGSLRRPEGHDGAAQLPEVGCAVPLCTSQMAQSERRLH